MGDIYNLIWIALFAPLAGFLIQAFFGKLVVDNLGPKKGKWLMGFLAVLPVALAFLLGAVITNRLSASGNQQPVVLTLFDWISLHTIRIPFEVRIDALSMTMLLIVTGVGALIHFYSTGYMAEEKEYTRFFTYMNLFIFCMLVLVMANNLAMMFIGWEGVGLCSYLLIGFWYKDINNAKAANKAFIVNRIGDWGLTLGMILLAIVLIANPVKDPNNPALTTWLSYDTIFANAKTVLASQPAIATTIGILLFIGACGKSAQFPLYFWLPDAMAGPTPVSALIHAATMVTAGVFMVNRMHIVFELSPVASAVMAMVGAFTALFAALIAFGQTDIKKVLAYSTVSQLGFMFIACGAGAYWAGIFHVATHAFFKALLFLGAGAVIHCMMHNQDMRNYGKLSKYMPITFWTMMAAYFAISGFPLLAGFYSKEAILGGALGNEFAYGGLAQWAGWTGLFVAMLTAFYMTRMMCLTFGGKEERWKLIHAHAHHAPQEEPQEKHEESHTHEDKFGFFYTDEEMIARKEPEEEHHELNSKHKPHEAPISMTFPLIVLGILSVVGGWWLERNELLKHWLYPDGLSVLQGEMIAGEPKGLPIPLLWLSIIAAVAGLIIGAIVYWNGLPKKEGWDLSKWSGFRKLAGDQFKYDKAVMGLGVDCGGRAGNFLWKVIDAGFIDNIFNGIGWLTSQVSRVLKLVQTGYVRGYALLMLLGGVAIITYLAIALSMGGGR
jgi:NADH-quinone oxidoreductase subunit L